jgi:hypothetical protein
MKRIVLLLACSLAPRLAVADECSASAVVEGDDAVADPVRETLGRRGIVTSAEAGCVPTRARIERTTTGFVIQLVDPDGRRSERTLADLDASATLIESWARRDINSAALLGWTVEALPPEPPPLAPSEAPGSIAASSSPRASTPWPIALSAAAEGGFDFTGDQWNGGRATACMRVGPTCIGALGRLSAGDARSARDVFALVDAEIPLTGSASLVGGVGAGYGWYAAPARTASESQMLYSSSSRLDAHLGMTVRIARHVALDLGFSVGVSPSAGALSATFDPVADGSDGDGSTPGPGGEDGIPPPGDDDPDSPEVPPNDNRTISIAEPFGYVRAGIGLRIGGL